MNEELITSREARAKKFLSFGQALEALPETSWTFDQCKAFVDMLSGDVLKHTGESYLSGTIYSCSLLKDSNTTTTGTKHVTADNVIERGRAADRHVGTLEDPTQFRALSTKLRSVYTYAFEQAYLWNSLHINEFGAGDWLTYQAVRMVADMFGGKPDQVMGTVTTGGTESIMTAVRCYREWGMANRGHALGEGVILALYSVHAAFDKGAHAYGLEIVHVPVDDNDRVDLTVLRAYALEYKDRLVCIVGSAPSYPLGTMDPIQEMAAIAREVGVGLHVDCCLGGFVVNFLDAEAQTFLRIPGVTSLSCDTHKNGWAPKGSSVLVTQSIHDRTFGRTNLFNFCTFAIPGWSGGIYGTPNNAGSQQCVASLQAVLAMASIGREKYATIAARVSETTQTLAAIVDRHECLEVIGDANINVCAWRIRDGCGLSKGAIYALVYEMEQLNVTVSVAAGERVHFCVTARSAADDSFVGVFDQALSEAIKRVYIADIEVKAGRSAFPGDGGLYGTFEAAMKPSKENTKSLAKRLENQFLGQLGAKDGIRGYFYALADPFSTELWG